MNIALVGFMGTGKSAIGVLLSKRLKWNYVDLDELIEKKENMRITSIFSEKGEPYFRNVEKQITAEVSAREGLVIACGGGVVLDKGNILNLKKNGIIICLKASPEVILERTRGQKHRPLLNVADPKKKIEELLVQREKFYAQADYAVDTSSLAKKTVVNKILNWLRENKKISI
ncbi:MAG: shikimate kinase [Candidatus Omnitrophica bacterium]|nr:shikimate kinase [Candidatus Omnitrophota bacterium]